jgi:hypothetical protein
MCNVMDQCWWNGRAGVNMMTILAMKYLGLRIDKLASVTLKMANN